MLQNNRLINIKIKYKNKDIKKDYKKDKIYKIKIFLEIIIIINKIIKQVGKNTDLNRKDY